MKQRQELSYSDARTAMDYPSRAAARQEKPGMAGLIVSRCLPYVSNAASSGIDQRFDAMLSLEAA